MRRQAPIYYAFEYTADRDTIIGNPRHIAGNLVAFTSQALRARWVAKGKDEEDVYALKRTKIREVVYIDALPYGWDDRDALFALLHYKDPD